MENSKYMYLHTALFIMQLLQGHHHAKKTNKKVIAKMKKKNKEVMIQYMYRTPE